MNKKSLVDNPFLTELKDKNGESWYHQIILEEKDKEIERLNNELKLYKDNHEHLNNLLQQKENIIKEVREYIETIVKSSPSSIRKDYANMLLIDYKKVLEILDKGE